MPSHVAISPLADTPTERKRNARAITHKLTAAYYLLLTANWRVQIEDTSIHMYVNWTTVKWLLADG